MQAKRLLRTARPAWLVRRARLGGFAIAHTARCGSTVLGDLLRQHPDVAYGGEVYGLHLTRLKGKGRQDAWADIDLRAVLTRELRVMGPGWVGIEFLARDLRETNTGMEAHAQMLRELGFSRFVLLRRDNLLRRYLSLRLAQSSARWHARDGREATTAEPARIHLAVRDLGPRFPDLLAQFAAIEQFYDHLRRVHAGDPVLELAYEQHIEPDPLIAYRDVAEFLGLRTFQPTVRVTRLNARTVQQCVTNFDEVAELLAPTRYAWMLEA